MITNLTPFELTPENCEQAAVDWVVTDAGWMGEKAPDNPDKDWVSSNMDRLRRRLQNTDFPSRELFHRTRKRFWGYPKGRYMTISQDSPIICVQQTITTKGHVRSPVMAYDAVESAVGSSGSPVFNLNNKLIGVHCAGGAGQPFGFAVHIQAILHLFEASCLEHPTIDEDCFECWGLQALAKKDECVRKYSTVTFEDDSLQAELKKIKKWEKFVVGRKPVKIGKFWKYSLKPVKGYTDSYGYTLLHHAADDLPRMVAWALCHPTLVSIDAVDEDRETALYLTCYGGHADCARLLVHARADLEKPGQYGNTPLHQACMYERRLECAGCWWPAAPRSTPPTRTARPLSTRPAAGATRRKSACSSRPTWTSTRPTTTGTPRCTRR